MLSIQNPLTDGVTLTSTTVNLWDFHVDWTVSPATLALVSVAPSNRPDLHSGMLSLRSQQRRHHQLHSGTAEQRPATHRLRRRPAHAAPRLPEFRKLRIVPHQPHRADRPRMPRAPARPPIKPACAGTNFAATGTPTLYQSGTINPDSSFSRFVPSIAQDKLGDAAVGYSISNGQNNPGIYFSYWNLPNATDPSEIGIIDGPGEEVSGGQRRGKMGNLFKHDRRSRGRLHLLVRQRILRRRQHLAYQDRKLPDPRLPVVRKI